DPKVGPVMSNFVDESGLHVKGGNGGAGAVSFRREAHTPKGGPDGGDGGKGGDVWLVADRNVPSLLAFRDHPFRRAGDGVHGTSKKAHGRSGGDTLVPVPEGTIIKDQGGTVLADLVREGDRWLAAEGGRGGRGNASFMSNRRRAPSFAEQGEVGQERWLKMELKLMADVALVGFPNAGKSTFISVVSAAKPKIADYPFTTLVPNLGVVRLDDGFEMVVADIPGLIEGASEGRGLGHQFLRHIERARVLLVLLDLASVDGREPAEQERILLEELGRYQPDLLDRPRVVVGSKGDVATYEWDGQRMAAITREGVQPIVYQLAEAVRHVRAEVPEPAAYAVHRPAAESFKIEREDDGSYVVVGREAERAVAVSDLTNLDALVFVHDRLKRMGVDRALARAGAVPGDRVRIGALQFEYDD
ncbi:MAG: Obg family GTPase CgtA, partial [Actinomycetia bacterium]|nr:Obg family GTPase CgtA [Actinomycetes bacterium]